MAGIDELLKTIQQSQMLGKQLGLHSQFAELSKSQEVWRKGFSGLSMLVDITTINPICSAWER